MRLSAAGVLACLGLAAAAGAQDHGATSLRYPRIVNGIATAAYPTTAVMLAYEDASRSTLLSFCSATLIGCRTVLTAAHCVCPDDTDNARDCLNEGVSDPSTLQMFLQNAGFVDVTGVEIHPDYQFASAGDLAIVTLAQPVTGIIPTAINTVRRPGTGTAGIVAGFGSTAGGRHGPNDAGIKREGKITTGSCTGDLPPEAQICWEFNGTDASTCEGDSGGPLFIDFGAGLALAGVTSGGGNISCLAPDLPFDTDVFVYRSWISARASGGLDTAACGDLVPVGASPTSVVDTASVLSVAVPEARWEITVPPGTGALRIALTGQVSSGEGPFLTDNDFDLFVKAGGQPTATQFDCRDDNPTTFGFCEFHAPAAGKWDILVNRLQGEGAIQLVTTILANPSPAACNGDCNGDGNVTEDELLKAVSVALGTLDRGSCSACDVNNDGVVTPDELLTSVHSALNSCSGQPAATVRTAAALGGPD